MRTSILCFILLISCSLSIGQSDSTLLIKKKRIIFNTATATLYGGSFIFLNHAWYKHYDRSSFHLFDDSKEWMQVDKFGHAQAAYLISANLLYPTYINLGYSKKQAIIGAASVAWVYQATIELLDGFSTKWGASMSDIVANTAGVGLAGAQQALWGEQRILFKYSTSRVDYQTNDQILLDRVERLYGTSLVDKLFKDYNGTTFWLSTNIGSFLKPASKFPKWLCVSVGYGAQGMLGGFENVWEVDDTQYRYAHVDRYRQYYLSLDVDFTKIPIKGKAWKYVAPVLNIFKVPSPALEFSKNGVNGHWIYF